MIGLKWSGVTRSDQSCMKHDGIKFRVNYFAHRARILFIFFKNMFQLKRSGTSWENCFGGNSFLLFPQFVRSDLEISIYKLILERQPV